MVMQNPSHTAATWEEMHTGISWWYRMRTLCDHISSFQKLERIAYLVPSNFESPIYSVPVLWSDEAKSFPWGFGKDLSFHPGKVTSCWWPCIDLFLLEGSFYFWNLCHEFLQFLHGHTFASVCFLTFLSSESVAKIHLSMYSGRSFQEYVNFWIWYSSSRNIRIRLFQYR